jgi:KDO2-lipid IV(A) lauroyltransferase
MLALSYYLAYPFIYLLGVLPFPVLYAISDFFAFLIRLVGYRRKVIYTNLRNSFPEKPDHELRKLTYDYYHYMVDLTLESFKMMHMSEQEIAKHIQVLNPELMQKFLDKKQSIILALGHYGNWEWYGQCFQLQTPLQMVIIYRPLTHPYFDRMMQRLRTRFNLEITTMKLSLRTTGIEKMARKFNYPVVYIHPTRPKRGYYTMELEVLVEDPSKTKDYEITEIYTRRLERDIRENPAIWLWSHRRWKSKRPQPATTTPA